jgi:hypothetical protein
VTTIRLFVDDTRKPFKGWMLARDHREALSYFRVDTDVRITELSLDWHMGDTGLYGESIAREMISRARALPIFDDLEAVYLHSSARGMATRQAAIFEDARQKGWIPKSVRIALNPSCRDNYGSPQ